MEDEPLEDELTEEGAEAPKFQVSVLVNRVLPGPQDHFVSPWPEMEAFIEDASNLDYERYHPPRELLLLLDEAQTPPEIQVIVHSSLRSPDGAISGSEESRTPETPSENPQVVNPSNGSHSRSVSTTSLSLSPSATPRGSDDGARHGSKKATFSTFLSSTTNFLGSVKQAMKDSSTAAKIARYETLPKASSSS